MRWKILLADDESYFRTGLQSLIPWEKLNCEIDAVAEDGQQLYQLAQKRKPDIIIADIQMPGLDGLDAVRMLRGELAQVKVIFLTAFADFSYARQAVELNAAAYIVKTDALEELPSALKKLTDELEKEQSRPAHDQQEIGDLRSLIDGTYTMREDRDDILKRMQPLLERFVLAIADLGDEDVDMVNFLTLVRSGFQRFSPLAFPMDPRRTCILLTRPDASLGDIAVVCEQLLPVVEGFCNARPLQSLSRVHEGAQELRAAYLEASEELQRHFLDGERSVFFPSSVSTSTAKQTSRELEALVRAIAQEDEATVENAADAYLSKLREQSLPNAKSSGLLLLAECYRIRDGYDEAPQGNGNAMLLNCRRFSEMEKILRGAVQETVEIVRWQRQRIHALIAETDQFLDAHYMDRLTLQNVADYVHASPSYLSRFYKEKTGRNLFDVINARKLDTAAELLRTTELKTYEIADRVGFSDTSYFSRCFKKRMGISPRDYARGVRRKEDGK